MSSPTQAVSAASIDRYEATFVVSLDPSQGDFTSLQPAVAALPASGGKVFVKAGVYPITTTIQVKASNIQIQGEGMGITVFVGDATMTGDTPSLEVFSTASDGTPRLLISDTSIGDLSIQVSPSDAASFNAGDYVLLYSNKSVDTENPDKEAGELKQVITIDSTAGVITLDDQICDAYTQADSAQVVRVTVLHNITLADFSITTQATSSTLRRGFTHFRFVENLAVHRVEVHDAYFTGIHLQSVRSSEISGCYVHHINDILSVNPPNPANERYGIVVGCASQNITISGCRFSHTRHAVTTGGSSGQNSNGVQRNIVVANCTSMLADTAHFDTHQPAENITFTGCMAVGGVPFSASSPVIVGFQMRGRNCSIVGCSVLQAIGKGIMIFGPVSSGAVISGNMIANVKAIGGNKEGVGIYFDSAGTSGHSVTGNVIKNCDGSGIGNGGGNNDIVIHGNVIENVNVTGAGAAAIQLTNSQRILIAANNIAGGPSTMSIAMEGNSDAWRIVDNHLSGGIKLTGVGTTVLNNFGYNPIGSISTPWPSSGTDLTNNVVSGQVAPQSGVAYTIRHTPKTITISGGDVSQILINGADAGSNAGTFKLSVNETIAVTYASNTPATAVFVE